MAILGIDEVGRGPLAGPLVMGGVILGDKAAEFSWYEAVTDSKRLSLKKREEVAEKINKEAPAKALGWVSAEEIDKVGMSEALRLGTRRVVEEIRTQGVKFGEVLIDGPVNFLRGTTLEKFTTTMPKADLLIKEVGAASIIAKVARDHYMYEAAEKYPGYGFERNVGYGTKQHMEALKALGPCTEHRRSFAPVQALAITPADLSSSGPSSRASSSMLARALAVSGGSNSTELGNRAETLVAEYLMSLGHGIIARNHKTKFYEIDIVSECEGKIYFTEVKYRSDQTRGSSVEVVTKKKLEQMEFAAKCFLSYKKQYAELDPLLMVAGVDRTGKIELIEVK